MGGYDLDWDSLADKWGALFPHTPETLASLLAFSPEPFKIVSVIHEGSLSAVLKAIKPHARNSVLQLLVRFFQSDACRLVVRCFVRGCSVLNAVC